MRTPNGTQERAPVRSKPSSDLSPVSTSLQIVSSSANSLPLCLKCKVISVRMYSLLSWTISLNTIRFIPNINNIGQCIPPVLLMHRGHICDPSLKGPGAYGSHMWGRHKLVLTDTSTIFTTDLNVYTCSMCSYNIISVRIIPGVTCAHTYFVGETASRQVMNYNTTQMLHVCIYGGDCIMLASRGVWSRVTYGTRMHQRDMLHFVNSVVWLGNMVPE